MSGVSGVFVVAHISDLHFDGSEYHRSRVEAVLRYINARADGIDALLITGDLVDRGTAAEYDDAFGTIHSPLPTLITIGIMMTANTTTTGFARIPGGRTPIRRSP